MRLHFLFLLACLCCVLTPMAAQAEVRRFAVIAGNNHGLADDEPLQYAISDAERVFQVLGEIGGFEAENMLLLRDATADSLHRALSATFERIRTSSNAEQPESSLLFVYYSGHADAKDLHLRDSTFSISDLEQLARAAPASVRLVALDACQSGALTRVKGDRDKGGRVQRAFALPDERELAAGEVFLTASASSEDAQESDEL